MKIIIIILYTILLVYLGTVIPWKYFSLKSDPVKVTFRFVQTSNDVFQLFYTTQEEKKFSEKRSKIVNITGNDLPQTATFTIDEKSDLFRLRLDFFNSKSASKLKFLLIKIEKGDCSILIKEGELLTGFKNNQFLKYNKENQTLKPIFINEKGFDPYIISKIDFGNLNPSFDWKTRKFIKNFESFFNEGIPWRSTFINDWGLFLKGIFKSSSIPDRLIVGKDNWLFLGPDFDRVLYDYLNMHLPDSNQLHAYSRRYENRRKYLRKRYIEYLIAYFPNKHSIYHEYMPFNIALAQLDTISRIELIWQQLKLNSNLLNVDLKDDFLLAKMNSKLYHKNDSHWTDIGAFIAYTKMMNTLSASLSLNSLQLSEFSIKNKGSHGYDLVNFFTKNTLELVPTLIPKHNCSNYSKKVQKNKITKNRRNVIILKNDDPLNCQKIVVFRDSYFEALIPFFASTFSETILVWGNFSTPVVNTYKPDIVIEANVERLFR